MPGIDTFKGHTFHTSRWDYAYTGGDRRGARTGPADKRIAIIGTGATALQCVAYTPRAAPHLYVGRRTKTTVPVRGNHQPNHGRTTGPQIQSKPRVGHRVGR